MSKKTILFSALGILLVLSLSGCFSQRHEVRHNPDGTGHFSIETIFTEDYLIIFDFELTMAEAREEILAESVISSEELPLDDPNIRSVTENDFIDPDTGSLHHIIEIEINNILEPIFYEEGDDFSTAFQIEDYGDRTFLFSTVIESLSEFVDEEQDEADLEQEELRIMLADSTVSWKLYVEEFIEGDAYAVYDPAENVVNWEIPLYDALFGPEPIQIFAIYRLEAQPGAEPEPTETPPALAEEETPEETPVEDIETPAEEPANQRDGRTRMPNWISLLSLVVLCLGLFFVVIVVVVIILLARKSKNTP